MAQVPVKLIIDNFSPKEREVATFKMAYTQPTDNEGQVTGLPRGGFITMRVKALNSGNCDLACWMIDPKQTYSGEILFFDHEGKKMKSYEFKDAYCVNYEEYWEDQEAKANKSPLGHWEEITISCRSISNGGAFNFGDHWTLDRRHYTSK